MKKIEDYMTKEQFISKYFMLVGTTYFSRYDIAKKGFAFTDATPYTKRQLSNEYKRYSKDEADWLASYEW